MTLTCRSRRNTTRHPGHYSPTPLSRSAEAAAYPRKHERSAYPLRSHRDRAVDGTARPLDSDRRRRPVGTTPGLLRLARCARDSLDPRLDDDRPSTRRLGPHQRDNLRRSRGPCTQPASASQITIVNIQCRGRRAGWAPLVGHGSTIGRCSHSSQPRRHRCRLSQCEKRWRYAVGRSGPSAWWPLGRSAILIRRRLSCRLSSWRWSGDCGCGGACGGVPGSSGRAHRSSMSRAARVPSGCAGAER